MFFELQLSAAVFSRIVRNRLKAVPLCVDREVPAEDGTPLVIDRIEIGSSTWVQREQTIDIVNGLPQPRDIATQVVWIFSPTNYTSHTVPFLQVKQEVQIHLVKASDMEANGPNPSPVFRTLTIHPVFNVALTAANQTQGGGPLTLSYSLAHVDLGILALGLSAAQRAEFEQFVAGIQLPPTTMDLGPLTALLNRPVSAINAGIACDPAGTFVAMRVDFDVYASPVSLSPSFFQAGPVDRLGGREWAMIIDANLLTADATRLVKQGLEGSPKLRLNAGPTATWDAGGAAIVIDADVELVDACPFFVDPIDMDAHVTVRSSLSVPTPNTLRTHHQLSGEPSDVGEEFACALTAALLWPFIGLVLLEEDAIDLPKYLGLLAVPPLIRFIGIIAAIETQGLSSDISQQLGSTCVKQDDENYECNDPLNIVMSLVPGLNSRLDLEAVQGVPEGLVLSGRISNLGELNVGSLDSVVVEPFAWQVLGRCTGNGTNNFRIGNEARITVGVVPPTDLCGARIEADPAGEFTLVRDDTADTVTITPGFTPVYTAAPYPCRVRLVTTRGVRRITLPPPAAMTAGEGQTLETERLGAVASCYVWEEHHTLIEELEWLIDPPVLAEQVVQHWQVVVRGLRPEESIRVEAPDGSTVMTARASGAGIAHMTLLFAGEQAVPRLSLELIGRAGADDTRREVAMQQVLYGHRASLPVRGGLREMRFEGGAGDRRLTVVDEAQALTWDVSAVAPLLLASTAPAERGGDGPVVQTGKRIGVAPSRNVLRSLERLRDRGAYGDVVASPRVGGVRETLAVRTGVGATLYDVSGDEPVELQTFAVPPWFEGTALGGDLLARHVPETGVVEIYAALARAVR